MRTTDNWNHGPQQPFYIHDQTIIQRQATADFRKLCEDALAEYNESLACAEPFMNVLDCRATRARMAERGFPISDDEQRVFEMGSLEEKQAVQQRLHSRIREKLDRAVGPSAIAQGERAIAELQRDSEQIQTIAPVLRKYGAQEETGRVLAAITGAIGRIREKLAKEFTTSWNPDAGNALNLMLPEDQQNLGFPVPPPPPAPSAPAPGALRTAADVATARAA